MDTASELITSAGNAMTTADWAIIISLISVVFAIASFIWNIWEKFIYPKPKVKVSASTAFVEPLKKIIVTYQLDGILPNHVKRECLKFPSITFSATNHGPGKVTLQTALGTTSIFGSGKRRGLHTIEPYNLYPYDLATSGIFSGGLPKEIDVGETISVYFPLSTEWFNSGRLKKFGFDDSFGRIHLCSRRNGKALEKLVRKLQNEQ